jgi:ubiquinone/menaquinone biosynthesis C-methylase UbiE
VRISLAFARFRPETSFADVHRQVIARLKNRTDSIRLLDVATGNCASLYKHGWMELDAQYTGIDLSETMILQGLNHMSREGVAIELALADATHLPFQADTFDVVTSYGAINGMGDPQSALSEMVRVMKKGGVLFFLDEQLYPQASLVERLYFEKVLSGHNTVHKCPVELLPDGLADVTVYQVYQFYYICVAVKV